jgi:lysophospholipase L1-like esterase
MDTRKNMTTALKYMMSGVLLFAAMSFALTEKKKITVYLVGDSTMSVKETNAYPETGWGMPFAYFFDSSVVVDNRAKNGRSTRTFISENRWQPVADALHKGDYVFIQFGHNDESKEKTDRYTSPEEFRNNLKRFVTETQQKGALPVIITPVARRKFNTAGQVQETHAAYAPLVREIAKETGIPLIDLDAEGMMLYQQFGAENSKLLFNQLEPGEHPNYPAGKADNTHFNELGARKIAQLVLKDITSLKLDLANHIVQAKDTAKTKK